MSPKLKFELSWIAITIVIIGLFILPILTTLGSAYPFYVENILFIIIFVTFFRFMFFTKHHWFGWSIPVKLILLFSIIPVLMFLSDGFMLFQGFLDEEGIYSMMDGYSIQKQRNMARFIKTEMIFNFTGALICTVMLPFAMLRSIWLQKNRNRV